MKLNYKIQGEGKPVIILHGIFGLLDNWQTIANNLQDQFKVITVDLRNHGRSPHSNEFNYPVMASDILELINDLHIDKIILIGHSLGGKIAMQFVADHPDRLEKLIIADMPPRALPIGHDDIFRALDSINLNQIETRKEADTTLAEKIPDYVTRKFILKSLARGDQNKFFWRFDYKSLEKNYANIQVMPEITSPIQTPTLFIRGGNSRYITEKDEPQIKLLFPNSQIATIAGAGHWVHADKPAEFTKVVRDFISA